MSTDTPQKIIDDVVSLMKRKQSAFERSCSEFMKLQDNSASEAECQECSNEIAKAPARIQAMIDARAGLMETALQQIAELEGDCEQQKFKLTRFQASQVARAVLAKIAECK